MPEPAGERTMDPRRTAPVLRPVRSFFDTNVLVYLFDSSSPEKQTVARELFAEEVRSGRAGLSTQVLQEFFVVVTRKLEVPLDLDTAERAVRDLAELPIVQVDRAMILSAVSRCRERSFSFWDALIVEAALSWGAQILYSEDFQHGFRVDGRLEIRNPFL